MNESCSYFDSYKCRSCALLEGSSRLPNLPVELIQLAQKILPWQRCSKPFASRAKAKMSISGSIAAPVIGILDSELKGVELLECPLHKEIINECLKQIPAQIISLQLEPYCIEKRTGNLKNIILQTNQKQDHLRLRLVLKEERDLKKLEKIKFDLAVKVSLSANIQPVPHQIPEGPKEHHIFGDELLWEQYNQTLVAFPAQSFMQVTPEIASKIYKLTSEVVIKHQATKIVDLFCGAGGFTLSVASYCKQVTGIEISEPAINAAKISASKNGLTNTEFIQADLSEVLDFLTQSSADTLICNPPRRGLGENVINVISSLQPRLIIYSSCQASSFLKDYERLSGQYQLLECTPFEMFPLTNHYEILALLVRK